MTRPNEQLRALILAVVMVISVAAMGIGGIAGTAVAESDGEGSVENVDTGEEFDTIQDAVNNANEGDTLNVSSGTYDESVTIDVEGLTLEAADGAEPTIEGDIFIGSEGGGSSNPTSADGTVIDGFELVDPDPGADTRGIGVTESSDVVIQNNEFEGFRTQISLDFAGDDVEDITLQGNTFENVGEGDAEEATAIGSTENVDGLDILSNEFINNRNDIGLADSTTGVTIDGNDFTAGDSDFYVTVRADDLDAQTVIDDNEFDPDAVVNSEILAEGNDLIAVEGGALASVVNAEQRTGFTAIQDAIDAAGDGDTLELAAGATFEEEVRLNQDGITLTSADPANPAEIQSDTGSPSVVQIDNDGTTISNVDVTVTEDGQDAIDDSGGAQFTLEESTVVYDADPAEAPTSLVNIAQPDLNVTDSTIEKQLNLQSGATDAVIEDSTLDNINMGGAGAEIRDNQFTLDERNQGLTMTGDGEHKIEDNIFSGEQIGISLASTENEITGNTFENLEGEPEVGGITGDSTGIIFFTDDANTVEGNTFDGEQGDLAVVDSSGGVDLNELAGDNTFDLEETVVSAENSILIGDAPVENVESSEFFLDIQSAVEEADNDETIEVDPGTYSDVEIDVEGLTLEGPNAGIVGDSDDRGPEASFEIAGDIAVDGVTIDGFELTGTSRTEIEGENTVIANADIKLPDGDAPFRFQPGADDSVITQNQFAGGDAGNWVLNARQEETNLINGIEITDNTFEDAESSVIQGAGFTNANISGNSFDEIGEDAIRLVGDVSGTEVTDNAIQNTGLNRDEASSPILGGVVVATDSDVTIEDNVFVDNEVHFGDFSGEIDVEAFIMNNDFDTAAGVDEHVGLTDFEEEQAVYDTINEAVDNAKTDATVTVVDGEYEEAVEVNVDGLTLEGSDSPTIDGEGDTAVLIGADNVELTGFELTSADANIVNLERDLAGGTTGVEVTENTFTDGERAFDTLAGTVNDDLTVSNNVIGEDVRFGILLQRGTEATVADNTINAGEVGISHEGSSSGGPDGELTATGNEIDVGEEGFELFNLGDESVEYTITDNTIQSAEVGVLLDGLDLGSGNSVAINENNLIVGTGNVDVDASETTGTVDATLNFYGEDATPTVEGDVRYDPVLTAPIEDVDVDEDGVPEEYGSVLELDTSGEAFAIGFTAPPTDDLGAVLADVEFDNGAQAFVYDGEFTPVDGSFAPEAGDVVVVTTETAVNDDLVVPVETEPEGAVAAPDAVDLDPGWNLVPTGATDDPTGLTVANGEILAETQLQAQPDQPGAPAAAVGAFEGTWVFVDPDRGDTDDPIELVTGYQEGQNAEEYLEAVLTTEDDD